MVKRSIVLSTIIGGLLMLGSAALPTAAFACGPESTLSEQNHPVKPIIQRHALNETQRGQVKDFVDTYDQLLKSLDEQFAAKTMDAGQFETAVSDFLAQQDSRFDFRTLSRVGNGFLCGGYVEVAVPPDPATVSVRRDFIRMMVWVMGKNEKGHAQEGTFRELSADK